MNPKPGGYKHTLSDAQPQEERFQLNEGAYVLAIVLKGVE